MGRGWGLSRNFFLDLMSCNSNLLKVLRRVMFCGCDCTSVSHYFYHLLKWTKSYMRLNCHLGYMVGAQRGMCAVNIRTHNFYSNSGRAVHERTELKNRNNWSENTQKLI